MAIPSVGEEIEFSWIYVGNKKWYSHLHMSYDPGISLLNIYLREIKTYGHMKTCIKICMIALFISPQNSKTHKCNW